MKKQDGFTLLEVLIAFGILAVVLSSVYLTQSSSLFSSVRTKNVLIATNLARNMLAETELKYTGVSFENIPKEEEGEFGEPNKGFRWKREVKEVKFSALTGLMLAATEQTQKTSASEQEVMVAKMFEGFLAKSVRKLVLTIQWPEGADKSSLSFTMLLVNYDADFSS